MMINLKSGANPEVKTFLVGEIKFQVEDFRNATGQDQKWEVTIELGEQVLKVVVPGRNSEKLEIVNSSNPTGSTKNIITTHLIETVKPKQPGFSSQGPLSLDEWVQSAFARRIATRAGL